MKTTGVYDALANFNPIGLEDMDRVKLMNRIDTKFAFDLATLTLLLKNLAPYYDVLTINNCKALSYESLYFDEKDFTFFKDHHNGKTNRYKVRIRNYVESGLFFFEIKHKVKGRTDKHRIPTEGFHDTPNHEDLALMKKEVQKSYSLEPKLTNLFQRITLVNKTLNERLTLDFGLTFRNGDQEANMGELVIAELKQERLNRFSPFYVQMKALGLRPYRLSKYCMGAIELYGSNTLKYNRFKRKLLYLQKLNEHAA